MSDRHVARAELVLARAAAEPLRSVPLAPDPLAGFAGVFADVWEDEELEVCVDLLPITSWQARGVRRRLLKEADRGGLADVRGKGGQQGGGRAGGGFLDQAMAELGGSGQKRQQPSRSRPTLSPAEQVGQRHELRELASKLSGHSPMFALQVLVQARSPIRERARAHVRGVISAWDAWAGENYLRASGRYILGLQVGSANARWRRGWFDRRVRNAQFAPAGRRDPIVTAREVGALLRPPTATNTAPNVIRQAASLPLAPLEVPTWTPQRRDLLPLGKIRDRNGERLAGVPLDDDTVFAYIPGKSRYGKTELALLQFVSLAAAGEGAMFLDPHHDALERARPYLAARPDIADRVVELDLTRRDRQPGWNPLAMAGLTMDDLDERVQAVVDAIASTQGWGSRNARALNLVTKGAEALCELALRVPPQAAPTIFEMSALFSREDWREAVMPFLRPSTREFWEQRFPRLPGEAITAVTNLLDRLRSSRPLAAMLGQPVSTIDFRRAMDAGAVVLACPGTGASIDQVAANLWFYDVIRAAKSRRDVDPLKRRRSWLYLDEAQSYDGAASGNIANVLEQTAKYGLRAVVMNQDPARLPPATLAALLTNCSHLITTAVESGSARDLARHWAPNPPKGETIANLPRYTYAAHITLHGSVRPPMGLRGIPLEESGHVADPDAIAQLDSDLDERLNRRPVREVLDELEEHPQRVLTALRDASNRGARPAPAAPVAAQAQPAPDAGDGPTPARSEVEAAPGGVVRVRPVTPKRRAARQDDDDQDGAA